MNFRTLVRWRYAIALPLVMLASLPTDVPAQTTVFDCSIPTTQADINAMRAWASQHQFENAEGSYDHVLLPAQAFAWPEEYIRHRGSYTLNVARVVAKVTLTGGGYMRLGLREGTSWIALCREKQGNSPVRDWALIIPPQSTQNWPVLRRPVVRHTRKIPQYATVDWRLTVAPPTNISALGVASWSLCIPCQFYGWCEMQ